MPDTSAHPLQNAFAKFLAPVPWLLEASILLELVLHKYFEAAIIAGLLVAMAPLPVSVVAGEFAAAIVFGLILDVVKIPIFTRLQIS